MDSRGQYMDNVIRRLSYLQTEITNRNTLNLTALNIHAENFYRDFFNLLGYSFTNTNFSKQNTAHIDLIDNTNKVAMQVTSQNDNEKISSAIKGFFAEPKYQAYKLEVLLISKRAKNYRVDFTSGGQYTFDHKKDVKDIPRILKEIENYNLEKIRQVADFLNQEVLIERPKTESTEVETIMALIDFLSTDKNRVLITREEDVDPEKKIYQRFEEHSAFITERYESLFMIYNVALIEARKRIDSVNARIISGYLKDESDELLTKYNNNPKKALGEMVNYFYDKLSENGFYHFDKQAIRYYLLDEMIQCNVFPN